MIYTLALRYARSVLALAKEQNLLNEYKEQLHSVEKVLQESNQLRTLLNNSQVSATQKLQLVEKIFGNRGLQKNVYNLLRVLVLNNRFFIFKEFLILFEELYRKEQNSLVVQITTSEKLSADKKEKIKQSLQNAFQCVIELQEKIDASVLGGIIAQAGSYLIDGSVRNFLTRIRNSI